MEKTLGSLEMELTAKTKIELIISFISGINPEDCEAIQIPNRFIIFNNSNNEPLTPEYKLWMHSIKQL